MPQLTYTTSIRDQAGEANSATPLTDNLQDIEDLATTGFDYENVEQWSLDNEHVYDGGGSPVPLKAAYNDYDDGNTAYAGPSGTWEDIVQVTVSAESGVSGVYIWAGLRTDATGTTTDTHQIRLHVNGGTITHTTRDIGPSNNQNGGGATMYALQAPSGSFDVKLQLAVTTGAALPNWHDAFVKVIVVTR
jgi:hypothetical protein